MTVGVHMYYTSFIRLYPFREIDGICLLFPTDYHNHQFIVPD